MSLNTFHYRFLIGATWITCCYFVSSESENESENESESESKSK